MGLKVPNKNGLIVYEDHKVRKVFLVLLDLQANLVEMVMTANKGCKVFKDHLGLLVKTGLMVLKVNLELLDNVERMANEDHRGYLGRKANRLSILILRQNNYKH